MKTLFYTFQVAAIFLGCAGCVYSATTGTISPQRMVREEEKTTTDPKSGVVAVEKRRTEVTGPGYSGANPKDFSSQGDKIESPDFVVSFGGIKMVGYDPGGIVTGIAAVRIAYYIGAGFILLGILVGWLSGKWVIGALCALAGFAVIGAGHFNTQYPWAFGAGVSIVCIAFLFGGIVVVYELYIAKKKNVTLQTIIAAVEKTSKDVQSEVKGKIKDLAEDTNVLNTVKATVSDIKK